MVSGAHSGRHWWKYHALSPGRKHDLGGKETECSERFQERSGSTLSLSWTTLHVITLHLSLSGLSLSDALPTLFLEKVTLNPCPLTSGLSSPWGLGG